MKTINTYCIIWHTQRGRTTWKKNCNCNIWFYIRLWLPAAATRLHLVGYFYTFYILLIFFYKYHSFSTTRQLLLCGKCKHINNQNTALPNSLQLQMCFDVCKHIYNQSLLLTCKILYCYELRSYKQYIKLKIFVISFHWIFLPSLVSFWFIIPQGLINAPVHSISYYFS